VITVLRTSSSSGEIGVDYETVNGTASAGADYEGASGTLIFHDGEVSKTFSVPVLDDSAAEEEKTVNLNLSNPTGGAVLGTPSRATLTIEDDDRPDLFTEIFDKSDNDVRDQTLTLCRTVPGRVTPSAGPLPMHFLRTLPGESPLLLPTIPTPLSS